MKKEMCIVIIKNRGLICKSYVIRTPKSSIPQRGTSVHLKLQVLYSKKNMLESNIRIWELKLNTIGYELIRVRDEIAELEQYAKSMLNDADESIELVSSPSQDAFASSNAKVIELEY
jgi:hypothetical protein